MRKLVLITRTGVLAATLALVAGCATNSDLDEVRAEVAKANQTASQAASDAAAARRAAEEARQASMETSEKLDRMFKKSMYK